LRGITTAEGCDMIESTPKNSRPEENSKDQLPKNSDGKLPLFYSAVMPKAVTMWHGSYRADRAVAIDRDHAAAGAVD
jgi:hypothetical protein